MQDREYDTRNKIERERLQRLANTLTAEDLRRSINSDWTVGAALAHLAFWDRFLLERWKQAKQSGDLLPRLLDDIVADLVNAAALPQWRALPVDGVVQEALQASTEVDALIEQLDPAAVEALYQAGRIASVDRSLHRGEHLDEIERAIK